MQFGSNIFDRIIRKYLFIKGLIALPLIDKQRCMDLIKTLKPWDTDLELIRLGSNIDGGYLVPNDLKDIEACFSPGVGTESSFEKACFDYNMKLFLADASVDFPDLKGIKHNFIKKNVGVISDNKTIRLDDWINSSKLEKNSDLLLQMDIEGDEYFSLINMSEDLLNRFRIIIIEFHNLDNMWFHDFHILLSYTFKKLLQNHTIVHLHPNNCCGMENRMGIQIPRVMEFTFLRNDRITNKRNKFTFPHHLDKDCIEQKPHMPLPKNWYIE